MSTAFSWNEDHRYHASPNHPERPERLQAVLQRLQESDVWSRLSVLPPLQVDRTVAALVHTDAYLDRLETATAYAARLDPDTYTTHRSLQVASTSLGAVLAVTDAVLRGEAENGFAASRPPGHHATREHAMGFCLLSNAAIAARWAQERHGLERVAIVDFDVHHGNGTQDVFYDDPSVLYMSMHQSPLYPGTGSSAERGSGEGIGTTINAPLPPGAGDEAMMEALRNEFEPVVSEFRPELLIVSAGFDAHWRDPLADLRATTTGFAELTTALLGWASEFSGGKMVCVLEGGYDLEALSSSVVAVVSRLLDPSATVDDPLGPPPG